jgi:serine O-acetyltransferase
MVGALMSGAAVLGGVTTDNGSSIGGNMWLTRDVPLGSNITQAKARNDHSTMAEEFYP